MDTKYLWTISCSHQPKDDSLTCLPLRHVGVITYYSIVKQVDYWRAWVVEKYEQLLWLDHTKILQNGRCLGLLCRDVNSDSVLLSISHITWTSSYPQVCISSRSFKRPAPGGKQSPGENQVSHSSHSILSILLYTHTHTHDFLGTWEMYGFFVYLENKIETLRGIRYYGCGINLHPRFQYSDWTFLCLSLQKHTSLVKSICDLNIKQKNHEKITQRPEASFIWLVAA